MFLKISEEVFGIFPELLLDVVIAGGISNTGKEQSLISLLRAEESMIPGKFGKTPVTEHPDIAVWRETYRTFGAKPKKYPPFIENLVGRILKGESLPSVNKVVDIYNIASLRYLLPAGGEDLDAVSGDICLCLAGKSEPPVRLLGEPEARPPHPGEVIYKDDVSAICRRWNWK